MIQTDKTFAFPTLLHGGDYNPDQWLDQPDILADDLRLMKLAHCNTFTLGVFSWVALEPAPGRFTFDWLAERLDRLHAEGHRVILATPSAGKPAWLAHEHPEVRRVRAQTGRRDPIWIRHNHCMTSPVYREAVARIDGALAEAFGHHPAVLMWHIGNEFSGECRCDLCKQAFRQWLEDRYGNLKALNDAWVNAFWGHTFTDWSEVTPDDPTHDAQVLDWHRFTTHQHVDFVKHEIAAVRQHAPDLPVTTNMMGSYQGIDYFRLAEPLDLISNDSYPLFHDRADDQENINVAASAAFCHDLIRSLGGGRPFLQMEASPTATNWMEKHKLKRPGVHRLEMMQTLAHGADGTMYFQWRKSRSACEKYHGAIVDHVGHENTRVFRDVAAHGQTLKQLDPIRGSRVENPIALMMDWETRWALESSQGPGKHPAEKDKGYMRVLGDCHRALWASGHGVDIVERRSDLSRYDMIVMPMAYLVDSPFADRIRQFVAGGGTVVTSWLTGIVDPCNRCHLGGWPGEGLRDLFGIWVEEWDHLYDDDPQQAVIEASPWPGLRSSYPLKGICDQLHAEGARVIATYGDQFYKGNPVITAHTHGQGQVVYVGADGGLALWSDLLPSLATGIGLKPALPALPTGVSAHWRTGENGRHLFLLNTLNREVQVDLNGEVLKDLETGQAVTGRITLSAYGAICATTPDGPTSSS